MIMLKTDLKRLVISFTLVPFILIAMSIVATYAQVNSVELMSKAYDAFRVGALERSAALAGRVLQDDPSSVAAHMLLGIIAAERQMWKEADERFETVILLSPGDPYGYFYLGQSSLQQQQWGRAADNLAKALERNYPEKEQVVIELALAQCENNNPERALLTLNSVKPPADPVLAAQFYAVRAFAEIRIHRFESAIEAIQRARDLNSSDVQYWELLISTLISTDNAKQALAEAIPAQRKFPDHSKIQFLFGLASFNASQYNVFSKPILRVALRNLREADIEYPGISLLEGLIHYGEGRMDEAAHSFEIAAEHQFVEARLLLGLVRREQGDPVRAEHELREAKRLDPYNGKIYLELGRALADQGRAKEALPELLEAAEYMPTTPELHYLLSRVYTALGDQQRAQSELSIFRELKEKEEGSIGTIH